MKDKIVAAEGMPGDRSESLDVQLPSSWLQEDVRR